MAAVDRYLDRLRLGAEQRATVRAAAEGAPDARTALAAVHAALAAGAPTSGIPAYDSVPARLHLGLMGDGASLPEPSGTDLQGHARLVTTPRFNRSSMAPHRWLGNPFKRGAARGAWGRPAAVRRLVLLALVLVQTVVGSMAMAEILPYKARQPMEMASLALFAILFAWISAGFWTAIAGWALLMRGRDRYAVGQGPLPALDGNARTALVMPIYNEDVGRVIAGLRATCESLERTGESRHFDVFILSDSSDAGARVAETDAWLELRRQFEGRIGIFYRWRQHHIKRKSGNVADFCRRWGRDYRYMVVLDADSVMSGDCLVRLARMMEADAGAGIIQTAPRAFGRDTLFARIQQFATAAYGPLFTAGLHFWQLGEAHYWGHNAIIRVEPFMRHCALGRLPGEGALSGEILSHDFVEAALMRRAGWGVWIAYDLPGSYEEMPPNLIDELARDRRWCLGNLMNLRLFRLEGLHPAHRAVFMIGVMAYVSAPLWFLTLLLGTALLTQYTLWIPAYFTERYQLYPRWPEWHPEWALALFSSTAVVLFLPKILALVWIWVRAAGQFGRRGWRASLSVLIETMFSALFAPIRMLFHTQFVVTGLAGIALRWKSPPRADAETTWLQALSRHGVHTAIGIAWTAFVWYLEPRVLPWVLPVAGALVLSIPLSVLSSRVDLGRAFRRAGLFLTPEELNPPAEVRRTMELARVERERPSLAAAIVDPAVNALACANATPRFRVSESSREERNRLVRKVSEKGVAALDAREAGRLLNDPLALSILHLEAWAASAGEGHFPGTPAGTS